MKRLLCLLLAFCVCLAATSDAEAGLFRGGLFKKLLRPRCTGNACSSGGTVTETNGGAVPAGPVAEPAPKAAPVQVPAEDEADAADEKPSLPRITPPFHGSTGMAVPQKSEQVVTEAPRPTIWEAEMVTLVNRFRAGKGLPLLRLCPSLLRTSRLQCKWMADRLSMQHGNFPVGENIATGQADPEQAMRTWINSGPHNANMSGRSWNRIGTAAYRSTSGRVYYTLQFSK